MMKTHLLNPLCLPVLLIALMLPWALHGQTTLALPTSGTAGSGNTAVDFEFRLDGSIIEKGYGSSTLTTTDLQSSSLFLWYPTLKALRVGGGNTETPTTIGSYSVALGQASSASNYGDFACGENAHASGGGSVAMGYGVTATGLVATALGEVSFASGAGSLAEGFESTASGVCSTALGYDAFAAGQNSASIGYFTSAVGTSAMAFGNYTSASTYASVALGQYNVGTGASATSWVLTDPLFEIGNGTSYSAKSDALVIYKNGNAVLQGEFAAHTGMRCAAGGDLSMGTFTAGTAP